MKQNGTIQHDWKDRQKYTCIYYQFLKNPARSRNRGQATNLCTPSLSNMCQKSEEIERMKFIILKKRCKLFNTARFPQIA
jgi:hypothetical protein